eukprot:XP_014049522.1 PREDICTED: uncharacterized protein LOC106601691 isoform X2 [Salmo salar]
MNAGSRGDTRRAVALRVVVYTNTHRIHSALLQHVRWLHSGPWGPLLSPDLQYVAPGHPGQVLSEGPNRGGRTAV